MFVTLVLTRKPANLFNYSRFKGRWGELVVIKGPKVTRVELLSSGPSSADDEDTSVPVEHGTLKLTVTSGKVVATKHFTSMERMDGYIQLHPKADPYWVTYENHNSVVKKLNNTGECLRVHGGKPGGEQGILIHEAPHVGWLIGCISPRTLGLQKPLLRPDTGNDSSKAMKDIISDVKPARADFFVLDW